MKLMVAFASPKRSRKIVRIAAAHAKAMKAELVLVRVIADPAKLGVIAELISTDTPKETAQSQIDMVVSELQEKGVSVVGMLKIGPVAETLVSTAIELGVDTVYAGSGPIKPRGFGIAIQDPILHYLLDKCPINLYVARDQDGDPDSWTLGE
jgi:nucleotide-binding universal stress UspA family protein